MSNPCLLFCPYLPLAPGTQPVVFADWELGPLNAFEERWADPKFKEQATTFLGKFVGPYDKRIENPTLLCRKEKLLDGQQPTSDELEALRLSLAFEVVDRNPRASTENQQDGWSRVTADNAELYPWLIDVEHGYITLTVGELVTVSTGGYKIDDPELVLRPPLELHMPMLNISPDHLLLTGIYETVLSSLRSPSKNPTADRVRVAVEWFAKAWLNTTAIQWPERLVYLKTAFEALTGTSKNWESARKLREIFESLPNTMKEDSEVLVWSPEEKPVHPRSWTDKKGQSRFTRITDLEHWFMEFGKARNTIIHEGGLPDHTYSVPNSPYNGHFFYTGEFLLRAVIKVLLSELGYENTWRPDHWRVCNVA